MGGLVGGGRTRLGVGEAGGGVDAAAAAAGGELDEEDGEHHGEEEDDGEGDEQLQADAREDLQNRLGVCVFVCVCVCVCVCRRSKISESAAVGRRVRGPGRIRVRKPEGRAGKFRGGRVRAGHAGRAVSEPARAPARPES